MKAVPCRARPFPKPPRDGFSLIELLLVLGVLALVMAMVVAGLRRAYQRGELETAGENVKALLQRAANEMKTSGQVTFVQLSRVVPPSPGRDPYFLVALWVDANGNGALDATGSPPPDTLVQSLELPPSIALSTLSKTAIASSGWSNDAADGTSRYLVCDNFSRTVLPGPPASQITAPATFELTHAQMVPVASASLRPPVRYQVRLAPVWSVSLQRALWDYGTSKWK